MDAWGLSFKEKEILRKLGEGMASKQIAADLHLSYNTIRNMCYRAKLKMKVKSVTQAVVTFWCKEKGYT